MRLVPGKPQQLDMTGKQHYQTKTLTTTEATTDSLNIGKWPCLDSLEFRKLFNFKSLISKQSWLIFPQASILAIYKHFAEAEN